MRWLLIDKIIECVPGDSVVAIKTFPLSDLIFMDHFPGYPIVPGVLQIEMIAQAAGKCASLARPDVLPIIGSVKSAKFFSHIHPGDHCVIKAQVTKMAKTYMLGEGIIEVNGKKVCSASILYGLIDRTKLDKPEICSVSRDWVRRAKQEEKQEEKEGVV